MTRDKVSSKTISLFVIIFVSFIFYAPFGLSNAKGENRQIPVLKVIASSDGTKSPDWPHHPEMVVDGNIYTCWASSRDDTIGAWLKFFFKEQVNLSSIEIVNGWIPMNYPNFFSQNHRAKIITTIFDDGSQETFVLEDTNKPQRIFLKTKRITKTIKIIIDAIYQAEQGEDPWVTISEISFYE
jgi:hypothetical protein